MLEWSEHLLQVTGKGRSHPLPASDVIHCDSPEVVIPQEEGLKIKAGMK